VDRPVDALVGPEAGDRDDAVVGLADRAKVLAGHVGGVAAVFSVAGVVDDQHAVVVGAGGRVGQQHLKAPLVELLVVPGRLRQEELQALHGRVLGTNDRFGAGQGGQRLVAVAGQQQPLQVGAQAAPLRQRAKQRVELGGVVLQRARCGWAGKALGHRGTSASSANRSALHLPPSSLN
jgi:hypothetical protein